MVLIYLLGGLLLYLFQEKFMFHPKAVSKAYQYKFDQPFEEINASLDNENVSIIKFPSAISKKGTALFFHGNMNNVEYYKKYPGFFTSRGYELWMIDYPGFGKSTGKRTEQTLYAQASLLYDLLPGNPADSNIIIYGKSIGTGLAAYLASQHPCKRLILETPYYSMKKLAGDFAPLYPVAIL
ncbi:MAG: alpha/beta hydrolase, partial [Flavisolibacter sp.]